MFLICTSNSLITEIVSIANNDVTVTPANKSDSLFYFNTPISVNANQHLTVYTGNNASNTSVIYKDVKMESGGSTSIVDIVVT